MSAEITVLGLRLATGSGALRAVAKVRLGGITISGVRVLQERGGHRWIGLPQVPRRRPSDGTGAGWQGVVELSDGLMSRVTAAVLHAHDIALGCPAGLEERP